MNEAVRIRVGGPEDLALIREFIRELAVYEQMEKDCTGTLEDLRDTLFGENPRAWVLFAFLSGQPAGFAVYLFSYSSFAARPLLYLEDLFVKPVFRGRGVARRIFAELEEIARVHRCPRIEWSVLDWNSPAIEFYKRLGATPQRAWVKYSRAVQGRG